MCLICKTNDPSRRALCGSGDHCDLIPDPWHRDAFPDNLRDAAPNQLPDRMKVWCCIDWCGNIIGTCGLDLGPYEDLEDVE